MEAYIEYLNEADIRTYFFISLLSLAGVVVFMGAFGLIFDCVRDRCCIRCYGTLLLPLWIVMMAFGGSAVYISYIALDELQNTCDDLVEQRKALASSDTLLFG